MDVTAHEIAEGDNIKEIYHATGGDYGGTKVDKEFEVLLEKIFGKVFMDEFRRSHPSDWLELTNDFEVKKRSDRAMTGEVTRIRLPANFINLLRHENGNDYNNVLRRNLGSQYNVEEIKIAKDYLCLGPNSVKHLFKPAIESIVGHLKKLLKKNALRGIKILFLVGGFSESPLLQARISKEFGSQYSVLIPHDAQTAVVKGAVMFGKRPHIVVERCLSETFGTDILESFLPGVHPLEKLILVGDEAKCKDIFHVLARQNEIVKIGESKKTSSYSPVRADQTEVRFDFFTSTNPEVRYTTDAGVRKLPGYITVESPDTSKGKDRSIQLRLSFETEIKAVGVDVETEKEVSTYIDFLSHASF